MQRGDSYCHKPVAESQLHPHSGRDDCMHKTPTPPMTHGACAATKGYFTTTVNRIITHDRCMVPSSKGKPTTAYVAQILHHGPGCMHGQHALVTQGVG